MGKLSTVLNGLFKKAEDTEKRYEKALEKKQEELIEIQAELTEKQSGLTELHKMYLLSDVSEATYKKEAGKVEVLQKKINEIQTEMQLIETYKTEDIKQIIAEMDEQKKELSAESQSELFTLQIEVLQAKYDYLSKLGEARERFNKLVNPVSRIEALKDKLGLKNRLYYGQDAYASLSMYSVANAGYISMRVEQKEIHDALYYGSIDSQLQYELKKHGKLEK